MDTRKEYDEKAYKLKQRQHELNAQMERYTKADQRFAITASALFELASRAYDLFESSEIEQKRQLINFVVPNFAVRGKNLEYSIRKPFDQMAHLAESEKWLPILDSIRTESESREKIIRHKINYANSNFLYRLAA